MNSEKIVCYLFTTFDTQKTLNDFINNYKKYKAGTRHKLIICLKLFKQNEIIKIRKKLKILKYVEFIDSCTNNDWDFGSYKRVAKLYYDKDILFLSSHSYPKCNNWLKKLFIFKNKNTVIAPTASNESLVDSIKLKNKFYKIIRYLIRKKRFKNNFEEFPNPHFRTSSFLINSKIFYNFIKNKKIRNKEDTLIIEAGKNGLTNYLKNKKIKIYVVNSDGKKFIEKNWMLSETYHYKTQSKCLISDKHSRKYDQMNNLERIKSQKIVWGV